MLIADIALRSANHHTLIGEKSRDLDVERSNPEVARRVVRKSTLSKCLLECFPGHAPIVSEACQSQERSSAVIPTCVASLRIMVSKGASDRCGVLDSTLR